MVFKKTKRNNPYVLMPIVHKEATLLISFLLLKYDILLRQKSLAIQFQNISVLVPQKMILYGKMIFFEKRKQRFVKPSFLSAY